MFQIIDAVARFGSPFDTPVVVVLGDVMRRNIDQMQAFADSRGVALRPHVKTHKSIDIALMQMRAGAVGITVSNLYQAEVIGTAGIDDIFMAFPLWMSEPKARRVSRLLEGTMLKVGVDSREAVDVMVAQGFRGALRLESSLKSSAVRSAPVYCRRMPEFLPSMRLTRASASPACLLTPGTVGRMGRPRGRIQQPRSRARLLACGRRVLSREL